jgi:glycosyltransferase involved in cell wall biosynthesis
MRILHAPTSIAGQPQVLSRALRRLGHVSDVLEFQPHPFGYKADLTFDFDRLSTPWRQIKKGLGILRLIKNYDVFHFYYGSSLLARHRDLSLIRRAGKRIVFHFNGCDIRMRHRELARRVFCACKDCPAPCNPDPIKEDLLDLARRMAHKLLVSTPDLLEWVPEASLAKQSIDLDAWAELPLRNRPGEPFVILHAPSDPVIKGTAYLQEAVSGLKAEGYPVELRVVVGRPHHEIRQAIAEADVVVDQLLVGWYGGFAVEVMASSRPVVAYIRDDLVRTAGFTPPILTANPETIGATLRQLFNDANLRRDLGAAGRPFVQQIHDSRVIAAQLLQWYKSDRS